MPFLFTDAAVNTLGATGVVIWYFVMLYLEFQTVGEFFE